MRSVPLALISFHHLSSVVLFFFLIVECEKEGNVGFARNKGLNNARKNINVLCEKEKKISKRRHAIVAHFFFLQ